MPAIWTRRALCQCAAGAAIVALAAPALGGWPLVGARSASAASENATRAVDAYRAMQRHFYVERDLLYREFAPHDGDDGSFAYFWTFEEAARATLYMSGMPGA